MASNNDNTSAGAMVVGVLAAMAMVFFFLAALVAFALTVVALMAWNKPLRIGRRYIMPDEARSFVRRGLVGAWVLPIFCFCVDVFLGVHINWEYLPHMIVFGYTAGSLGLEIMFADDEQNAGAPYQPPADPNVPSLPPQNPRSAPREPFRYASWDDEENRQ